MPNCLQRSKIDFLPRSEGNLDADFYDFLKESFREKDPEVEDCDSFPSLLKDPSRRTLMALTAHRKHKIYLAATMGYGLGSDNPEEVAFYNKIMEEINDAKRKRYRGIAREE